MKKTFATTILSRILVLLGFAGAVSCEPETNPNPSPDPNVVVMYGMPYMSYKVSEKVADMPTLTDADVPENDGEIADNTQ